MINLLAFLMAGCRSVDPAPYLVDFRPLPSVEEQQRYSEERHRKIEAYISAHPGLTEIQKAILSNEGGPGGGLTKEQIILLIGEPDKVERGILKYGADEMWFYRNQAHNDYYYFKGELLIKVDPSRDPPDYLFDHEEYRQRRLQYLQQHPEIDPTLAVFIECGTLINGLSVEQVELIYGPPTEKVQLGNNPNQERWYYRDAARRGDPPYLYFKNGQLETVHYEKFN